MPQTIFEWIFSTLNSDPTLAALWGEPASNPYSVAAEQQQFGTSKYPYCIYSSLGRKDKPAYENPRGPGPSEWIFSFSIYATGSTSAAGADQARAIFKRIDDIFAAQMAPIGVGLIMLELGPIEHWFSEERAYRIHADYRIRENLACL